MTEKGLEYPPTLVQGQSEVVAMRGGRKQSEVERSYQRWRGVIRGGGERPEL